MENFAIEMIEDYGYFGVMLLMFIESIFPPIPSEVVLSFAGFVSTRTDMTPFGSVIYATAGSVLGAILLYILGNKLGHSGIRDFARRHESKTRIKYENIDKAVSVYRKHQKKAVFFCRMVPVVRSLISIPAGFSQMNFGIFLSLTVLGTVIWNSVMVTLGYKLGELWIEADHYIRYYSKIAVLVFAAVFIIYIIVSKIRKRRKEQV